MIWVMAAHIHGGSNRSIYSHSCWLNFKDCCKNTPVSIIVDIVAAGVALM